MTSLIVRVRMSSGLFVDFSSEDFKSYSLNFTLHVIIFKIDIGDSFVVPSVTG